MTLPTAAQIGTFSFGYRGTAFVALADNNILAAGRNDLSSGGTAVVPVPMMPFVGFDGAAVINTMMAEVAFVPAGSEIVVHALAATVSRSSAIIDNSGPPPETLDPRTTYSTGAAINLLNIIAAQMDAGVGHAHIQIYGGGVPVHADSPLTINNPLLVDFICPKPACPLAVSNLLTFNTIPTVVAVGTGLATFYRAVDSAQNVVFQGVVGTTGSAVRLDNVNVAVNAPVVFISGSAGSAIKFYEQTIVVPPILDCDPLIDVITVNLPTPLPTIPLNYSNTGDNVQVSFELTGVDVSTDVLYHNTVSCHIYLSTNNHPSASSPGTNDAWIVVNYSAAAGSTPSSGDFVLYEYKYDSTANTLTVKAHDRFSMAIDTVTFNIQIDGSQASAGGGNLLNGVAMQRNGCGNSFALRHYVLGESTNTYTVTASDASQIPMITAYIKYYPNTRTPEYYYTRIGATTANAEDNLYNSHYQMLEIVPPVAVADLQQVRFYAVYNDSISTNLAGYESCSPNDPTYLAKSTYYNEWDQNYQINTYNDACSVFIFYDTYNRWCYEVWRQVPIDQTIAADGNRGSMELRLFADQWRTTPNYPEYFRYNNGAEFLPNMVLHTDFKYTEERLYRLTIGSVDVAEGAAGIYLGGKLPLAVMGSMNFPRQTHYRDLGQNRDYPDIYDAATRTLTVVEHNQKTGYNNTSSGGVLALLIVHRHDYGTGTPTSMTFNNGWTELVPPTTIDDLGGVTDVKITQYIFWKRYARGEILDKWDATAISTGEPHDVVFSLEIIQFDSASRETNPFAGYSTTTGTGPVSATLNPQDMTNGCFVTVISGYGVDTSNAYTSPLMVAKPGWHIHYDYGGNQYDEKALYEGYLNSPTFNRGAHTSVNFVLSRPYVASAPVTAGTVEACADVNGATILQRIVTVIAIKQALK